MYGFEDICKSEKLVVCGGFCGDDGHGQEEPDFSKNQEEVNKQMNDYLKSVGNSEPVKD